MGLGVGLLAFELGKEIVEELFVEEIIFSIAYSLGCSNAMANLIGESSGMSTNTMQNLFKTQQPLDTSLTNPAYQHMALKRSSLQSQLASLQALVQMDARLLQHVGSESMTVESEIALSRLALSALTSKLRTYISGESLARVIQTFRMNTLLTEGMIQVALGFMAESEVKDAYLGATFMDAKLRIIHYDNIVLTEMERRERIEDALWTDRHLSWQDFLVKNREAFGVPADCEQYVLSGIKGVGFMKAQENGQMEFLDLKGNRKYFSRASTYQVMAVALRSNSLIVVDPKKSPSGQTDNDNSQIQSASSNPFSEYVDNLHFADSILVSDMLVEINSYDSTLFERLPEGKLKQALKVQKISMKDMLSPENIGYFFTSIPDGEALIEIDYSRVFMFSPNLKQDLEI